MNEETSTTQSIFQLCISSIQKYQSYPSQHDYNYSSQLQIPVSILFNEELTPKTFPYSDSTQVPKKRNHTDESNTDKYNSTNDQTPSNKRKNQSDWMSIDTCTTCFNRDNFTSTTWKEELDQLKQENNNNI